jgi:hypothetical protein
VAVPTQVREVEVVGYVLDHSVYFAPHPLSLEVVRTYQPILVNKKSGRHVS